MLASTLLACTATIPLAGLDRDLTITSTRGDDVEIRMLRIVRRAT